METYFWTIPSFRLLEKYFLSSGNRLFYLRAFSFNRNCHRYEWKLVFQSNTNSCWWELICWLAETIFFQCLRYFSRSPSFPLVEMYFSVQKKKYCFLFRAFFSASWNHYSDYRKAYLKLLFLLLATIFYDFSRYFYQWKQFSRLIETYS